MADFDINRIKAELVGGGARPSLFQVMITNPINPVADIKVPFMVEAASLPASQIDPVELSYMGRKFYEIGDRTFEQWNTTVINDEDFLVRNALEEWHNAINALERNVRTAGPSASSYKSQATVTQYGKDGTELRTYKFIGIWPTQIAAIDLSWQTQNEIERFQVTWQYDYYVIDGGTTGDAGGQ